jgi:hypothetical protein
MKQPSKKGISFKTHAIFGKKFKPDIHACFCSVSKLLFNETINIEGLIDFDNVGHQVSVYELWSYIYYLYFYNNKNIDSFTRMMDNNNKYQKASASNFYNEVISNVQLDHGDMLNTESLILFINKVILDNQDIIVNPVIIYLKKILSLSPPKVILKTGELSSPIFMDEADIDYRYK